jgi:hypothetical protein
VRKVVCLLLTCFLVAGALSSCKPAIPDPCSQAQMPATIKPITQTMRAFDDTTALANIMQPSALVAPIMDLQSSRRDLENLALPQCLDVLQKAGVTYMNSVINYLGMFMVAAGTQNQLSADNQKLVSSAVSASQNLRIVYEKERARLLGEAFVPPATVTPGNPATPSPTTDVVTQSLAVTLEITNPSTAEINLRSEPNLTASSIVGTLPAGGNATATQRTALSDWLLVNYNQVQGWVYSSLVQVNGTIDSLPVFGQATP